MTASNASPSTMANNIASISNTLTLLWTNSSPTSSFGAQTITISGGFSSYKYIVIECYYSTNTQHISDTATGTGYNLRETSYNSIFYVSAASVYRACTINKSAGTIAFQVGVEGGGGANNADCIPGKIYGL